MSDVAVLKVIKFWGKILGKATVTSRHDVRDSGAAILSIRSGTTTSRNSDWLHSRVRDLVLFRIRLARCAIQDMKPTYPNKRFFYAGEDMHLTELLASMGCMATENLCRTSSSGHSRT